MSEQQRIGIFCVGNILMRDEGVGPWVAAELLRCYDFPPQVEVLDCGVMGMALLADIQRFDVLVVIDAVDATGYEPGAVLRFAPEDIAPHTAFHRAHETRLIDVLEAAALLGFAPETCCFGIQVLDRTPAEFSIGLTPPVEAAVAPLIHSVLDFLAAHGVTLTPYHEPGAILKCPPAAPAAK
jgi:hydrogenase maturation protease